jgi:ABC-type transport system involved in cytochrome c biogenesis permease subunit
VRLPVIVSGTVARRAPRPWSRGLGPCYSVRPRPTGRAAAGRTLRSLVTASSIFYGVTVLLYLVGCILSAAGFKTRSARAFRLSLVAIAAGALANVAFLSLLAVETATFPGLRPLGFFGLYALTTVVWSWFTCRQWKIENTYFSFLAVPLVAMGVVWAIGPRPANAPHLGLGWMVLHLGSVVVSISAFTLAGSGGAMLFVQDRLMKEKSFGFLMENLPSLDVLDEITYRNVALGFVFFSLAVLLGFAGAPAAWGSYLPMNAKVLASLLVWGIYGYTLHSRSRRGWRGKRLALFSLAGFAVILLASFAAHSHGSVDGGALHGI